MKRKKFYTARTIGIAWCLTLCLLTGCGQSAPAESLPADDKPSSLLSLPESSSPEETSDVSESESSLESDSESSVSTLSLPEEEFPKEKIIHLSIAVGDKEDLQKMLEEIGEAAAPLLQSLKEEEVVFTSRSEGVAAVDEKGTLTAAAPGTAVIIVEEKDSGKLIGVLEVEVTRKEIHNNLITPTMWEVTDADGHVMYLLGTIHAADSDAMHLPDYFEEAFQQCDCLAVECDVASPAGIAAVSAGTQKLAYQDGTTIKDHIPEKDYEAAVRILQSESSYVSLYDNYQPIMWVSLLESAAMKKAGLSTLYGVDTLLLTRAKLEKKEILELESVSFQMDMMAGFSEEIQKTLLHAHVKDGAAEEMENDLKDLYLNWKNGTLSDQTVGISEEENTSEDKTEAALLKNYNDIMIFQRNKGMANKALEYLKDGKKVMLTAGSAHFYGDQGIVALLRQQGCTIKEFPES